MPEINEITNLILQFRNDRDWKQFHNPKDLAIALNVEAGELLEQYLWKQSEDADRDRVKEELADIFMFAFLLAHENGFDIKEIIQDKLKLNADKYPIDKSKGNAKKYNEL